MSIVDEFPQAPATLPAGVAERRDCSEEEYHRDPAISNSKIEVFRGESPATYFGRYHAGDIEDAASPSMELGTLIHQIALHPDCLGERIICIPHTVLSANGSKAGKAWQQFADENAGKVLLKPAEFDRAKNIRDGIFRNADATRMLHGSGWYEDKIWWGDDDSGLDCRAMLDRRHADFIADIKTSRYNAINAYALTYEARKRGWHRKAAFYRRGVAQLTGELLPMFFLVVQTSPPYSCVVYALGESWLGRGDSENRESLLAIANCYATKSFYTEAEQGGVVTLEEPVDYSKQWEITSNE